VCPLLAANDAKKNPSSMDFTALIKQLDEIKNRHNVPTYAVVISDNSQILLDEVRGLKESGANQSVSKHAYFRIGSITKNFVALATLVAENNKQLKLSDRVTNYLDDDLFLNPFQKEDPMTIEQLLEHSAGFPDMGRKEFASNDVVTLKQGLERFASSRKVLWSPGQLHSYSNTSYGLAGRVLEIATATDINTWLTKSVFESLDMKTATMNHTDLVKANLVPGYQADGIERIPYWNMIYPSLGAINLQPRDMAKLLQFYLNRGAGIFTEQQVSRLETPKTTLAAKQGLEYGYGLGIYQWYRDGHLFFGHGGDADGYLAHFGYQKEVNLGYFVVINTFNNRAKREMQKAIESFIIESNENLVATATPEVTGENLSYLEGNYFAVSSRFSRKGKSVPLRLKWEHDRLMIKEPNQSWQPLLYLGNGLFRRPFEPAATTAVFLAEGKMWFQGDEGNFIRQDRK
jgi:CubicO group peptidase (beta-lactamase class C family)